MPKLIENVYYYEHQQHDEHILRQSLEHIQCEVTQTILRFRKHTYHIFIIYFTNM